MLLREVRERLDFIRTLRGAQAHKERDRLWEDILLSITRAGSLLEARDLASEALKPQEILEEVRLDAA